MRTDSGSNLWQPPSRRRRNRQSKHLRSRRPQFQIESRHVVFHIDLHLNRIGWQCIACSVSMRSKRHITHSMKMMSRIRLVSGRDHHTSAVQGANLIQVHFQLASTRMTSVVRPHPKADDERLAKLPCLLFQVGDRRHNIILLIRRNILRNIIELPQIRLRFLDFHHRNITSWCRTDKIGGRILTATGNARKQRSVPIFIPLRHDRIRIIRCQSGIDIFLRVFDTICESLRGKFSFSGQALSRVISFLPAIRVWLIFVF